MKRIFFFSFLVTACMFISSIGCSKLITMPVAMVPPDTVFFSDTTYIDTSAVKKDSVYIAESFDLRIDRGRDRATHSTKIYAPVGGVYRIFTLVWFNSGNDQKNESCFITINEKAPFDGMPYIVIQDPNEDPSKRLVYGGFFYLKQGDNVIETSHYGLISDKFPEYLNGPVTGPESIYIRGFILLEM